MTEEQRFEKLLPNSPIVSFSYKAKLILRNVRKLIDRYLIHNIFEEQLLDDIDKYSRQTCKMTSDK